MSNYSAQVAARASVVRYWRQGDLSGTTMVDTEGAGNGTYPGSGVTLNQTSLISGDSDKCTLWDGGGHGTCSAFSPGSNWTVEAILKPTLNGSAAEYYTIIGRGDGAGELYLMGDGKLNWYTGGDNKSTGTLSSGVTAHIAVTASGSTGTFYINGASAGTFTATAFNSAAVIAGNTFAESYEGYLDELSVNNAALSGADVDSDYDLYIAGEGGPTGSIPYGFFDTRLRRAAWFRPRLVRLAWFDKRYIAAEEEEGGEPTLAPAGSLATMGCGR